MSLKRDDELKSEKLYGFILVEKHFALCGMLSGGCVELYFDFRFTQKEMFKGNKLQCRFTFFT